MTSPAGLLRRAACWLALGSACALAASPLAAGAALSAPQRAVLVRYLTALQHQQYAAAFALLSPAQRRYFGSPGNLASAYEADRLRIGTFQVLGSTTVPAAGTVAVVREHLRFFDHAHQTSASFDANVRYGIVAGPAGPAVKDPYHPWHASLPANASGEKDGLRATVRKLSFFTGRVELVVTFANYGSQTVTLIPYGRSVLRDDGGRAYVPIATKIPGLTDKTLFEGLRLAPSAQYTGALTFPTADRFAPRHLAITFAPNLTDGADAPFELAVPAFDAAPRP